MRAALQYAVAQICTEEEVTSEAANMSSSAIQALTELMYQFATMSVAKDLVAFSKHANRRTITVDDVLLSVRRNKQLSRKLQMYADDHNLTSASRRSNSASGSATTTASPRSRTPKLVRRNSDLERQCQSMLDSTEESSDDDRKPAATDAKNQVFRLGSMNDESSDTDEAEFGEDEKENKHGTAGESIELDLDTDTEDEDDNNDAPLRKRLTKLRKKDHVMEQPATAKKPLGITTSFSSDDSLDEQLLNR
jgi:histone H3/H4